MVSTLTFTAVSPCAIFTLPEAAPWRAFDQSMLTHRRSSFATEPRAADTTIHGSLGVAVYWTAPVPRLNTSIKRRCRAMELNLGRMGSPSPPGQAAAEFSTATPRAGGFVAGTA